MRVIARKELDMLEQLLEVFKKGCTNIDIVLRIVLKELAEYLGYEPCTISTAIRNKKMLKGHEIIVL